MSSLAEGPDGVGREYGPALAGAPDGTSDFLALNGAAMLSRVFVCCGSIDWRVEGSSDARMEPGAMDALEAPMRFGGWYCEFIWLY